MEYPKTDNKVVCIVGTGYAWDMCVFGNPKHDYWTLNNMYEAGGRIDLFDEWFQIHRPGSGEGHVDDPPMRKFLQQWEKPTWVQKVWGEEMPVKNPWVFPVDEVIKRFCPTDVLGNPYPYFSNTVDYMICLAIMRGYSEMQLFGVEFISDIDDEYYKMRQSVNFYVGRALEAGVKVIIQPHSSLLKNGYWYGYESPKRDPLEKIMKENLQRVKQEKENTERQRSEIDKKVAILEGGKQTLEQLIKIAGLRDKGAQI